MKGVRVANSRSKPAYDASSHNTPSSWRSWQMYTPTVFYDRNRIGCYWVEGYRLGEASRLKCPGLRPNEKERRASRMLGLE
ncbi:hypothetical protein FRC03_003261 [Tulasnella sp. 419]|nr:hypothetical protein FRC03_003261 [Tulasnella sp. 419]